MILGSQPFVTDREFKVIENQLAAFSNQLAPVKKSPVFRL